MLAAHVEKAAKEQGIDWEKPKELSTFKRRDELTAQDLTDYAEHKMRKQLEEKVGKDAREAYLACQFLKLTNEKYKPLRLDLENGYLLGERPFPLSILKVKRQMDNYTPIYTKGGGRQQGGRKERGRRGRRGICGDRRRGRRVADLLLLWQEAPWGVHAVPGCQRGRQGPHHPIP